MINKVGLVMVAAASVLAAGCATMGSRDSAADEAAVRAVLDTYVESENRSDVDLHASIWDEAGIQYRMQWPAIVGLKALRTEWQDSFPLYTIHMTATIKELVVSGDWAFAYGVYTSERKPKIPSMDWSYIDGKFLTIFKREHDGTWKIYADAPSPNTP